MKVSLFDFQKDALHQLRDKLTAARNFASSAYPQAIAFSAPTGSGKTIVMTALFEAILDAPDDQLEWPLDWQPQADAVILWVSDMPELNEQTKLKIERQSDRVYRVNQLIPIDASFDAERLDGGRVYFINTQKLGNDKRLTRVGDSRAWSIWTTLSNTAQAIPDRFYVVIDEAHRGMAGGRGAKEARTLMQRFLLGYPEVGLIKMPLVIGVSATPKRFMDLLEHAPHTVHKVAIPAEAVRQSGLLKDRILIHHPEAPTTAEMALLEEAARRWARMTTAWAGYCKTEGEQPIWPVLVVQVENATAHAVTKTSLSDALNVIESALGRRLNEGEVAHAMHDTGDMDVGGRRVRKVDASRIDADKNIGVVFFKTSLSTGWDCPRAEVMMSFRRAEDHTYIAQLLGRMVRTPPGPAHRARCRAERRASVPALFRYAGGEQRDRVVAQRRGRAADGNRFRPQPGGARPPCRNGAVFAALDELITYRVNAARAQSHLRRYMAISRSLTMDEIDDAAWDGAKRRIVEWMTAQIDGMQAAGRSGSGRLAAQPGPQAVVAGNSL